MKLNIPTIVLDPHFEMDFSETGDYLSKEETKSYTDKFKCLHVGFHVGVRFEDLTAQDIKKIY